MEQYGWAVGVGIIIIAVSLGKAEERVDFAERLLAKQRETDRLAHPPS